MPRVPLELIGQVCGVERGTIYNHWCEYKARGNETKYTGCPPAFSSQELDEIIGGILHGFEQRCELTLSEIASIVQNKFQKFPLPDTLCHVLTRDPRLKLYRGQPIDERRMTIPNEEIQGYFATSFRASGMRGYR
jgi:hypothetical protein